MLQAFFSNDILVQTKDVGGLARDHTSQFTSLEINRANTVLENKIGKHIITHSSFFQESRFDEEVVKLLARSPTEMYDLIDDTSEPSIVNSPKKKTFTEMFKFLKKEQQERPKLNTSMDTPDACDIDGIHDSGLDDCVGCSVSFPVENNDCGIESREGDEFPLIRVSNNHGTLRQLLTSWRLINSKGTNIPMNNNDQDDLEDGKESHASGLHYLQKGGLEAGAETSKSSKCSVGILLASISCIFFATSSLIVKVSPLHPMELLCVRGLLQGIFVVPIIISSGSKFLGPKGSKGLLMTRATLGSVSLVMAFNAIHLIPLADAATIIFTSPVFVSLFACVCLGELCSWFDVFMVSLTLVGVLLVSRPSFGIMEMPTIHINPWTHVIGIFCGVFAAMLTALAFIVLRQLKNVHYSVTVFWFSSVLAVFGAVLTIALDGFKFPDTWLTVIQCLGIGICGFLGQILLTKALQLENAGPVAVARTLDIVLSFFYQITFLHDTPDVYSYCGSILVVACVVLTAFKRWLTELQEKRIASTLREVDRDPNI